MTFAQIQAAKIQIIFYIEEKNLDFIQISDKMAEADGVISERQSRLTD